MVKRWLSAAALGLLVACSAAPPQAGSGPAVDAPLIGPGRLFGGGFLAPPAPIVGAPRGPGTGMFVKLVAPTALALRGNEMLVLDSASARLWRVDIGLQTLSPVAGAPTAPGTPLALGIDLSAWVLDAPARQVLRFGRDGRLMQTFRGSAAAPAPSTFALADSGAALLVADGTLGQWAEWRPVGAFATAVAARADGARIGNVDALAATRDAVYVLDRAGGVVHKVRRDGQVLATFGRGELKQPSAIAVDRFDRLFVVDAFDRTLKVLREGEPTAAFTAQQLGVLQIGAIAIDERTLAVADPLAGQVALLPLQLPREGRLP